MMKKGLLAKSTRYILLLSILPSPYKTVTVGGPKDKIICLFKANTTMCTEVERNQEKQN